MTEITAISPELAELATDITEVVKHTLSTGRKRRKKKACAV